MINGSGAADASGDSAAAVLNGFEGVALDPEAEAAIAAALEACAARARAAEAAYERGGEAAIDAAEDDPGESFVRVGERSDPYRGELLPPVEVDEFVPFIAGRGALDAGGGGGAVLRDAAFGSSSG